MNAERIAELKKEIRKLQAEQYNLIGSRRNPGRFGQIETQLETLWKKVDELRK